MQASCLVNLVYLNGSWEEGFTRAGDLPFYAKPDRADMVPMMTQRGAEMPYTRRPSFSCIRLPFACRSSHMAIFVPALRSGGMEQDLLPAIRRWADMRAVLDALSWSTDVTVTLPKVLLESPTMDLRKCLQTLDLNRSSSVTDVAGSAPDGTAAVQGGVAQTTSSTTSVSSCGGSSVRDLRVEGLYHKATLDLTTKGGKSPPGFSTLLSVCSNIPANEPVRFIVDRPFVFAVLVDGLLLMVGLVRNIQTKERDDVKEALHKYFM